MQGDLLQSHRHIGVEAPQRLGVLLHLLQRHADGRLGIEGQLSAQHLKEDDAHRVDIGPLVHGAAQGLLRADVVHRADGVPVDGTALAHGKAGNAEVHHLDLALFGHHDILRLDIPVDDAVFMGALQGGQHQPGNIGGGAAGDRLFAFDVFLQGDAADILHHQIGVGGIQHHIVDFDDIGVRKGIDGPAFIAEAPQIFLIGGIFIPQYFYRDGTQRLGIKGPVDIAHAAYPHQLLDEIAVAQLGSQYIFHVFCSPLNGCASVRR